MTEKVLKSVLPNYLGTFTSRYSDYDGYWIFGMILLRLDGMKIDLLRPIGSDPLTGEMGEAVRLARGKFHDQVVKHGLQLRDLHEAYLNIEILPGPKEGFVGGSRSTGREVRFKVDATSRRGKRFVASEVIFVAPHDPRKERQSARAAGFGDKLRALRNRLIGG